MRANASPGRRAWRWAAIGLAVLPWLLPLAEHLWLAGASATGFLGYEAPYYVANGREIFERGNGFAYPNPSDPHAAAPVIYFHWLPWIYGVGVKGLGLDPGAWFGIIGVIAALLCGAATLRLVETMLPGPRGRWPLFFLTMWGGGLLCLGSLAARAGTGEPWGMAAFALDAPNGWWFPNWGRNLMLGTEAVYHLLVALAWLGALRRQWGLALGALAAVAATHPFTGVQQLLIFGAWLGFRAVRERSPQAWRRFGVVAALFAVFAAYYFGWLESFEPHRRLRETWGNLWSMPLLTLLLGTGPVAAVAAWRLHRQRWRLDARDQFLVVAFLVTLALLKHDWLIAAHQPAHFSRGYNWLPVWLLALPQLQAWAVRAWAAWSRRAALAVLAGASVLLASDNLTFLARELVFGEFDRHHLSPSQREMFGWMDRARLDGVMLCADARLSYLASTYSGVRPYFGHLFNTPDAHGRWRLVKAWQERGERGPWFETIDYVLVDRRDPPAAFDWPAWRELHRNADYILLARAGPTSPSRPRPRRRTG